MFELAHRYADVNGVRLHYVEAGPEDGPLVMLLHGFPELWASWRHQIPVLADAGFRVLAPDMRGFNLSEKPRGVGAYHLKHLTADVAGLVRHAGRERASVVGHDWGGSVAWNLSAYQPGLVDRLVILNSPHPRRFFEVLRTPAQMRRSAYMLFYLLPWLPEAALRRGEYSAFRRTFQRDLVHKDAISDGHLAMYVEAMQQPGACTSGLNYYRAAFRHPTSQRAGQIDAPTLLVWGDRDRYLGRELSTGLERWVANLTVAHLDASHWVQQDAAQEVSDLLVGFLER